MSNEEDYILVWDAPKIEAPEFRLYYKKDGSVDFYTANLYKRRKRLSFSGGRQGSLPSSFYMDRPVEKSSKGCFS